MRLAQFAQVIDFTDCGTTLWDAIKTSVALLPETVVHCAKVPASLSLLLTLSSSEQLVPLLQMQDEVVPCVISCLADTSTHSVVEATLSFIDNLLVYDEQHATIGSKFVIRGHIDLILRQFLIRIGGKTYSEPSGESQGKKNKGPFSFQGRLFTLMFLVSFVVREPQAHEFRSGN